ncbi:MAG: outer membrane protein assembly factor BamD [Cocleimonas sp.]|nr:outer membrane protein assembly factor BamD [Cocleimonas sp.]
MRSWTYFTTIVLLLILTGCTSLTSQKKSDPTKGYSANKLFQDAQAALKERDYPEAIKKYEVLQARYPLGRFAQQSLLESAFAYYKYDEADTALDTIDRYTRMYPRSPKMDYALYLRGLINFNRGGGLMDKIFPRSFSDLDNVRQKESFHDFSKLLTRHPKSEYAKDARHRMKFLTNALGQSEVNIAKYYMKRNAYVAAFNRADYTIQHHQGTPAVIEALKVKICAAKALGKKKLAADTKRVLQLNFPNIKTIKCNYK